MFLPVLSHFQNENPWSASMGRMRFRVLPDPGAGTMTVETWEGPWAREFSTVELQRQFPLSQEGLDALPAFLEQCRAEVDARPERTMEENIARRLPSGGQ